jgi:hypothetical protein
MASDGTSPAIANYAAVASAQNAARGRSAAVLSASGKASRQRVGGMSGRFGGGFLRRRFDGDICSTARRPFGRRGWRTKTSTMVPMNPAPPMTSDEANSD